MIAAIYARKSTEQTGVADHEKSVTRQIDHATDYAAGKGWTVAQDHIYVDDGISGAEFANRPGFLRLMNALTPTPPFQVLIMSEESRLGREAIETAYALKQLVTAGVRVFFYLEDRERTLDSPTDKIMLSLTAYADELEREKARQRTYDAMVRKAKAGHVTGGRVFGYDNVEILGPPDDHGRQRRSHVERRINNGEAHCRPRDLHPLCARMGHAPDRKASQRATSCLPTSAAGSATGVGTVVHPSGALPGPVSRRDCVESEPEARSVGQDPTASPARGRVGTSASAPPPDRDHGPVEGGAHTLEGRQGDLPARDPGAVVGASDRRCGIEVSAHRVGSVRRLWWQPRRSQSQSWGPTSLLLRLHVVSLSRPYGLYQYPGNANAGSRRSGLESAGG